MCEIFAINARKPVRANDYLRTFFADSVNNPHGWGLAWREQGKTQLFKEPVEAVESAYLDYLMSMDISSDVLLAHIRNATRGIVSFANCHPFQEQDRFGHTWLFAHNGTLLDDSAVVHVKDKALGTTDSELLALYLTSCIDTCEDISLQPQDCFEMLESELNKLSVNNKLNVVFDNGEYSFVYTNTIQATLWVCECESVALICSRPLDDNWEEIERATLRAYKEGKRVFSAQTHGRLFDNDLYMRIIEQEQQLSLSSDL